MLRIDDMQRQAVDLFCDSDISLKKTTFYDIMQEKWKNTEKYISVNDLSYDVPVYTTTIDGEQYEFAAGERSNCVWNFYLYKH